MNRSSSSSPSHKSSSPPVAELLNEGRVLHARGRVSEAFARYQAALIASPDDADAMQLLGLAYLGLGQGQVGIAFLRRAVERRPESAEFRAALASAEARLGRLDEALAQMGKACELQPGEARWRAGRAQLQTDEPAAEADFEAAIALAGAAAPPAWREALAGLRYRRWAMAEAMAAVSDAATGAATGTATGAATGTATGTATGAAPPAAPASLNIGWAEARHRAAPDAEATARELRVLTPGLDGAALVRASAERDLVVIDDFLADPLAVRAEALRLCAAQAAAGGTAFDGNFPGVQTAAQPCQPAMQRIADALGRDVKWNSPDNGALRISIASDAARADVHVDNPTLNDIFGGVLYLSLPEHCQGGTRFYRHRASGWERRPDAAALKARGFSSFLDFQKRSLPANRRMSFDEWLQRRDATWEALFEIPMRFNRLILFRSDFFHSITELFGDTIENGRLVQLFHFEGRPAPTA